MSFSLDDWLANVEGKRGALTCSIMDVVEAVRVGKHKRKDIIEFVHDITGASERTIIRRISEAVAARKIQAMQSRGRYTLK